MDDREFSLVSYFLEDNQKLLAAGKVQRWEAVKWAVTVNLALATASISFSKSPGAFFILSTAVAVVGGGIAFYHDAKISRVRQTFEDIFQNLTNSGVDFVKIVSKEMPDRKTQGHDWSELSLFWIGLALSAMPTFFVYLGLAGTLVPPQE